MGDPGIVRGSSRHFHHKYKFVLQVGGVGSIGFKSCSELKMSIAKIEYYEGGVITAFKEPGRITVEDITLERAAAYDPEVYNWVVQTAESATNFGLRTPKYKRGGWILQLDRDNTTLREWQLYGLWPTSFTGGAWDNMSDDLTMEQVTLAVDYFVLRKNIRIVEDSAGDTLDNALDAISNNATYKS